MSHDSVHTTQVVRVGEQELTRATQQTLRAAGLSEEHAAVEAEALVYAELRGQGSHGVSRLLDIYVRRLQEGATNPDPHMSVVSEHKGTAIVDGDNGPGQVVGAYGMQIAIDKAREYGVGCVAVRNSNHYGAAAFYLQATIDAGMIGFTTTNSPPNMPPWGGRQAYLGTNPLAFAVPARRHDPILLDMATSVVAKGKIQLMVKEGQETIPAGWALDAEGNETTSVAAAVEGMMLPVGGHKGYGLALMVEILSALISGADFGPHLGNQYRDFDRGQNVGHFFGALSLDSLGIGESFVERVDQLIDELKTVPRRPGVEEILMPGEIECRTARRLRAEGIPIDPAVYDEISRIAAELGVEPPAPMA